MFPPEGAIPYHGHLVGDLVGVDLTTLTGKISMQSDSEARLLTWVTIRRHREATLDGGSGSELAGRAGREAGD